MISPIDVSKPLNKISARLFRPAVKPSAPCSAKPFCANNHGGSFVNSQNAIYTKAGKITTQTTKKNNYPYYELFGQEETIQNIYSSSPAKLRVGVF